MRIEISIESDDRPDALAALDSVLNRKVFVDAAEINRAIGLDRDHQAAYADMVHEHAAGHPS